MATDCLGVDGPFGAFEMKIKFYANEKNARARRAKGALTRLARRLGLVVTAARAEVVIALGGDGTILRAVHAFPETPVLGFNLGGLGYLASVEQHDFENALKRLAKGQFRVSARTLLQVGRHRALNDVVVMREQTGHAAVLDVAVDGRAATRYMADGLIVATPTGSTAYSLSAGGPVLMPDSGSWVITPLNPHALAVRPIVVRDDVTITVTSQRLVNGDAEKLGVYADGQSVKRLGGGESIQLRKAATRANFVELAGSDPYEVMSRKLGWSK